MRNESTKLLQVYQSEPWLAEVIVKLRIQINSMQCLDWEYSGN